jgi:hypothetical protein
MKKNTKLLILENEQKWDALMNSLVKCEQCEEPVIIKQIGILNEELKFLKEIK